MSNLFAILDLPESLILESGDIEASWREKTRAGESGELHEARATLTDPVRRLEHWLQLRKVEAPRGSSMPPRMMDLFSQIHGVLSETDAVITKLKSSTTALMRAVITKSAVQAQLKLQECMQQIQQEKAARLDRFAEFEKSGDAGEFAGAVEVLGQLKFLRKWEQQCQERLLSLLEF